MTTERDMDDEMKQPRLDVLTADRLLSGDVAPQDAPRGYQLIADTIQRAIHPGAPTDARRERATVAAMVQTLHAAPPVHQLVPRRPASIRRGPKIARARGVKVAAIAAAVVLGASAAGAATEIGRAHV